MKLTDNRIIDAIKALAAPPENAVAAAKALLETLELKTKEAEHAAAQARDKHNTKRLELLASDDEGALSASMAMVEKADLRVLELRTAVNEAKDRVARAEQAENHGKLSVEWSHVDDLLELRAIEVRKMAAAADVLCDHFMRFLELNEAAWTSVPEKPEHRPQATQGGDALARLQLHLFAKSNGHLGSSGWAPFVAGEKAELVERLQESDAMFNATRSVPARKEAAI